MGSEDIKCKTSEYPDDVKEIEKSIAIIMKSNYCILKLEKNGNDLSKLKYYPVLLLYREPYFIFVNKNKWNLKINNFNELLKTAEKNSLVIGIAKEDPSAYYPSQYLIREFSINNIDYKYQTKESNINFFNNIDIFLGSKKYANIADLKPIASLSNLRYQNIVINFPLRRVNTYIAPTIGETAKTGVEYSQPYILYAKIAELKKGDNSLAQKIRAELGEKLNDDLIYGQKLEDYIKKYELRIHSLQN